MRPSIHMAPAMLTRMTHLCTELQQLARLSSALPCLAPFLRTVSPGVFPIVKVASLVVTNATIDYDLAKKQTNTNVLLFRQHTKQATSGHPVAPRQQQFDATQGLNNRDRAEMQGEDLHTLSPQCAVCPVLVRLVPFVSVPSATRQFCSAFPRSTSQTNRVLHKIPSVHGHPRGDIDS